MNLTWHVCMFASKTRKVKLLDPIKKMVSICCNEKTYFAPNCQVALQKSDHGLEWIEQQLDYGRIFIIQTLWEGKIVAKETGQLETCEWLITNWNAKLDPRSMIETYNIRKWNHLLPEPIAMSIKLSQIRRSKSASQPTSFFTQRNEISGPSPSFTEQNGPTDSTVHEQPVIRPLTVPPNSPSDDSILQQPPSKDSLQKELAYRVALQLTMTPNNIKSSTTTTTTTTPTPTASLPQPLIENKSITETKSKPVTQSSTHTKIPIKGILKNTNSVVEPNMITRPLKSIRRSMSITRTPSNNNSKLRARTPSGQVPSFLRRAINSNPEPKFQSNIPMLRSK